VARDGEGAASPATPSIPTELDLELALQRSPAVRFDIALADALDMYRAAGWKRVFPLPVGEKDPPPEGVTGATGQAPSVEILAQFRRSPWNSNLGIAMPQDLIGIDVDQYGDKRGAGHLANLEHQLGAQLPPTVRSSSRGADNPSGIRLYRVPPGLYWLGELCPDVEIIAWHYRYLVGWPSIHPEGRPYLWYDDSGEPLDRPPLVVGDHPDLPWQFIAHATRDPDTPADYDAPEPRRENVWHPKVLETFNRFPGTGSLHSNGRDASMVLARYEQLQLAGATAALDELGTRFIETVEANRDRRGVAAEWARLLTGARHKARTTESTVLRDTPEPTVISPPNGDTNAEDDDTDDDTIASWCEVDLTAAIRGDKVRAQPTILRRSDGRYLFYEGQVNYLHGADGVGKSYVALFGCKDVLDDGGHVVWLDWEDPDEVTIVGRLGDLGVAVDVALERFHYISPQSEATPAAVAQVCDIVHRYQARLVVVDSIGEAFGVDGVNEDRDNEVGPWMRRVLRPLAATGAGVLPVDHGIKSGDNPLFASGSKRKRAAVTGSHFLVEAPRPLSKEYNGGQLKLTTAKDRHGNFTRGKPAAVIDVAIYPDGGWTVHIDPPPAVAPVDGSANDLALVRAMIRVVRELEAEIGGPVTQTMAETSKRTKGTATAKRGALQYAAGVGCLTVKPGARGAHLYSYVHDLEDPEP
jgi:Bifunctional DNA primase/polymerase, N-terminal/AAA domain